MVGTVATAHQIVRATVQNNPDRFRALHRQSNRPPAILLVPGLNELAARG